QLSWVPSPSAADRNALEVVRGTSRTDRRLRPAVHRTGGRSRTGACHGIDQIRRRSDGPRQPGDLVFTAFARHRSARTGLYRGEYDCSRGRNGPSVMGRTATEVPRSAADCGAAAPRTV